MLTDRVLNRTLLERQHLLGRVPMSPLAMTEHLVGLQAQDVLPPYLSLWSRVADFDPAEISDALGDRRAVRILLMRGTIHLVTAADCLLLRPLVQGMLDKITRTSQVSREAADVPRDELAAAGRAAFADGPLPFKALGEVLEERFPGYPARALANSVREMLPLVQVPPRGLWRQAGGVVYETAETWLGGELACEPDLPAVVRRYLRAFGPATAADVTAWSRVTGMKPVLDSMDGLVTFRDAGGRLLHDLEGLRVADSEVPAPVRLLGKYDNLWLSHADKTRVTTAENRKRWMGLNGGVGNTVFVDGMLEGLWRETEGRVELELFRELTRAERQELDAEVAALETLLAHR
ncbi:MAG TPA: winged helix DNA-binding domain-containing protein [Nocardioidaceae bacterium]|nr:winged helix DNA-binding domain-containing protein [Nocardioidaceae bacterium]